MSEPQHVVDAAAAAASSAASAASLGAKGVWTGVGTTVVSWLVSSQAGVVCGMLLGIVSLLVQWWYRHRQDQRDAEAHGLRMLTMRRELQAGDGEAPT